MLFSTLIGNEPIKAYLSRALALNHLHHTLLFSGLDGVGKCLFAKELAQEILGDSSLRVLNENHPDLHMFRPEGKSGTHLVESLRELIEEVHRPPFEAKKKVFIICEAERMLPAAANAILKTLEEPDLDCQIILLSSAPNEILPTILSRCVQLFFHPIPRDLIAKYLMEKHGQDLQRAHFLSQLAGGSMGHAVRLLQDQSSEKIEKILFDALEKKIPRLQAIEQIDAFVGELDGVDFHRQAQHVFAAYLMWARDRELKNSQGDEKLLFFPGVESATSGSLAEIEKKVAVARIGLERNVKLSACLDFLLKLS